MNDLTLQRRFFAEELEAVCKLRSPELVDAFAVVPRERFLRRGPWTVLADSDFNFTGPARTRETPDADPRRVYHNIAVAIDPSRQLFNGQPGTLGVWIDALNLQPGDRVLHVGCGLGYYTAVMAHCVGSSGRVVGIDVDEELARGAVQNLASIEWVEVRHGDGADIASESFDAILVNAGVTHPHDAWLDALRPGGRLILPLTCTMAAMSPIGKGWVLHLSRNGDDFAARTVAMVAIYSAVGLRDSELNDRLGQAFRRSPFPPIKRLRRDAHEPEATCWLHGNTFCLSTT